MQHAPKKPTRRRWPARVRPAIPLLALAALLVPALAADRVVRKDGRELEGRVVSLDAEVLVIETSRGLVRLPRAQVERIELGDAEPSRPPLKVEIRNVHSDDSLDVLLHDEPVITGARRGGAWIDVTDKLNTGNNPLRLRIHNNRGTWAYQLHVRVNGVVSRVACGTPLREDGGCDCCGKTGKEQGVIDDLPPVWIHADLELGEAEVIER